MRQKLMIWSIFLVVVSLLTGGAQAARGMMPIDNPPSINNSLIEAKGDVTPLTETTLNIEHNATDHDTGFQGFVDSEGWERLVVTGPEGKVLTLDGQGKLGKLGLTELFFETVEPENADIP